jgi:uncharacterized protein
VIGGVLGLAALIFLITHPRQGLWILAALFRGAGSRSGGRSGGGFRGGGGRSGGGGARGHW